MTAACRTTVNVASGRQRWRINAPADYFVVVLAAEELAAGALEAGVLAPWEEPVDPLSEPEPVLLEVPDASPVDFSADFSADFSDDEVDVESPVAPVRASFL